MSIFKKIITAVRGGATEAGEAIVDANSTRIFEQEIRDSEKHITIFSVFHYMVRCNSIFISQDFRYS